ncbi:polysaccharide deacetylase family protein [uncultured Rikenella sp.]|uniref:polysaccharide deacetylase family protein n=1 Tax=uncultured Rikenella sp. TaxID=368003 RepID=UPI0025DE6CD7|nr:polysaccharide deacetylase family protein [uncultured Rikenella sp.]
MEQVIAAGRPGGEPLPPKAVLLTFDDGYTDHFTTVFPILKNRNIQGSFFAPIKALTENTVLDVNKIHFILASGSTPKEIINHIRILLEQYGREGYELDTLESYYQRLAGFDRFDTPEVLFIKRLLQVELPLEVRTQMTDSLFTRIVGINPETFSRELYMTREQMQCMVDAGMHIGSHGYDHFWFNSLPKEQQEREIDLSIRFIKDIYGSRYTGDWTICYPYGGYNEDTLDLLRKYGCAAGFTTTVKVADLSEDSLFTLPRLDTNDIPKSRDAQTNDWYAQG